MQALGDPKDQDYHAIVHAYVLNNRNPTPPRSELRVAGRSDWHETHEIHVMVVLW